MQEQIFYLGIIENNNDPLKLYRCQVRIWGIHTENKSDTEAESYIPVDDLPWADVLMSGSGMDGHGEFTQIVKGSTVIISFLDPEKQKPIIIGTLPRIVAKLPDFESGFSDPDQIHPDQANLNESSISRLARNENIDQTIIQDKIDNIKTGVDCNGTTWDEPQTQYNAVYPNNRVIQTRSHIFEMDDSEGVERIHVYHGTGSSKEFHPDGSIVDITKKKNFTIVIEDDNILIEGSNNIRIEGSQNIYIIGDENKRVGSNRNVDVDVDENKTVGGNRNVDVDVDEIKTIGGNHVVDITGNETKSAASQTVNLFGPQNIISGSEISLTAPKITLDGIVEIKQNLSVTGGSSGTFSGDMIMTGTLSGVGAINLGGNIASAGTIIDALGNTAHHPPHI